MAMGRGGAGGWDLRPCPAPRCGAYDVAPSSPLRASQGPALPHLLCIYYRHLFEKHETMCKKKKKKKKLKQLEHDKKHTYCLLEALSDQPFFFPFNRAPLIATNKNTNFK